MANEIDLNDAFAQELLSHVRTGSWSGPKIFDNREGDCIEVWLSDDSYRAERVDSLVTVYVNRENGELVGALVKGVRSFIRKTVATIPGFVIEIMDGKVKLEYLFTAGLWSHGKSPNCVLVRRYRQLREMAEEANLEVELEPECT
ncbi:MAG: hypothetical protein ACYC6N_18850 [Pirellulaceae bacterium]